MANSDRRRFLKGILGALAGTAGTVVLATTSTPDATAAQPADGSHPEQAGDIQARAAEIANAAGTAAENEPVRAFLNGAFRNGGFHNGGGFRNGGFRNGGFFNGGGFRNGGFANGAGGGFRNGSFRNY
jgi:hypothetical protein